MAHKRFRAKLLLAALGAASWLVAGCEADMQALKRGNNSPGRTQRPTGVSSQIAMASKPETVGRQRILDKWLKRQRAAQTGQAGQGAGESGAADGAGTGAGAGAAAGAGGTEPGAQDASPSGRSAADRAAQRHAAGHGGRHALDGAFEDEGAHGGQGTAVAISPAVADDSDGLVARSNDGAARIGAGEDAGRSEGEEIKRTNSLSARGRFHLVAKGEDVQSIAGRYGVPPEAIVKWNPREARDEFPPGVMIYIPSAAEVAGKRQAGGPIGASREIQGEQGKGESVAAIPRRKESGASFAWPLEGAIVQGFVPRGAHNHPGIDIGAAEGTPVKAAKAGHVIYSGPMRGYGQVVILDHKDGTFTVYGHNKKNFVRTTGPTSTVAQGQVIAVVGHTGSATSPKLHFEVRRGNNPVDPQTVLPRVFAITGSRQHAAG